MNVLYMISICCIVSMRMQERRTWLSVPIEWNSLSGWVPAFVVVAINGLLLFEWHLGVFVLAMWVLALPILSFPEYQSPAHVIKKLEYWYDPVVARIF
jgi:hypothetical protein